MGPGSRDNAMRWLPELPPATKVPSAAAEPGAVSHPQVRHPHCSGYHIKSMLVEVTLALPSELGVHMLLPHRQVQGSKQRGPATAGVRPVMHC